MRGSLLRPTLILPRAIPQALLPRPRPAPAAPRITRVKMTPGGGGGDGGNEAPSFNPRTIEGIDRMRQVMAGDPLGAGGWDECWKEGLTPWDLGKPTPIILHLLEKGSLHKGRALIPGCGTGYDVPAIADPDRYVVGLDISEVAVKKAQELFASSENLKFFTFVAADFFTWHPSELFDLIIDYTFFCAIEPCMRSSWAAHMQAILKPEGELITIIFPIGDFDGGPPYAVSLSIYEEVLHPLGFKAASVVDNEQAVGPRKGREKLARWKRTTTPSPL